MTKKKSEGTFVKQVTRYLYKCGDCKTDFEEYVELKKKPYLCDSCQEKKRKIEERKRFEKTRETMLQEIKDKKLKCPICTKEVKQVDTEHDSEESTVIFECEVKSCHCAIHIWLTSDQVKEKIFDEDYGLDSE